MRISTWTINLFLAIIVLSSPVNSKSNEGRLIVRFKEGVSTFSSSSIHRIIGSKFEEKLGAISGIELVSLPEGISAEDAAHFYQLSSRVLYAEPDFEIQLNPIESKSEEESVDKYAEQWALNNSGQKAGKSIGKVDIDLNAPESWELTEGSKEIIIGIIDTGIFHTHPDLQPNMWVNPGEIAGNGIDDDKNGYVDDMHGINAVKKIGDPMDDNGHGTHCAGIIGGSHSAPNGIFGINKKISMIGCKFLTARGGGKMSDALLCMDYFAKLKTREENPVDVVAINNSWGGGRRSQSMVDAIQKLSDLGILFVAAAGNDGMNNDRYASYPASYEVPNVISVAATTNKDKLAYFSNYGRRSVHIGAPGMDIMSTFLDDKYKSLSGTSMATPYVTGLIALLKSERPELDWKELRNTIISSGNKVEVLARKTVSGRRIRGVDQDGLGALTCDGQTTFSRISPRKESVKVKVGEEVKISALNITCGEAAGEPEVSISSGETLEWTDELNDGLYNLTWKAEKIGNYELRIGDGQILKIEVKEAGAPDDSKKEPVFDWPFEV